MMTLRTPLPSYYCLLNGANRSPQRVLLIEPDDDDRQFIQTIMENLGYNIVSIRDVNHTLNAIARYRPTIILLDVRSLDNSERILDQIQSQQHWHVLPINIVSIFAPNRAIA